jgi:predicted enzyme related to lactoylglutathione lyase
LKQRSAGGAIVYAKDLARVARFYEQVCGMSVASRDADFVALKRDGLEIVVVQVPEHIARTFEIASPPERREDSALKLVFPVPSIAAARGIAPGLGGIVDGTAREWTFNGSRVCDGHDPEGNVIQLREPGGAEDL